MTSRNQYSELHQAYNSPYYQPIGKDEEQRTLDKMDMDTHSELVMVYRENVRRYFYYGAAGYCVLYPLMRIQQLQMVRPDVRFIAPEINYRWSALKFIFQKEGPNHLWRGVVPGALYWGSCVGGHFLVDDALRSPEFAHAPDDQNGIDDVFKGMLFTTILTATQLLFHPLHVAQVKMATDIRVKSLSTWYRYATSVDCLLRTFRYNGFLGLYKGSLLTAVRNYIIWWAFWFHGNEQRDDDMNDGDNDTENGWPLLYPYRFEWRALQTFLFLYPMETIITRRIFRSPTFRNDRLPHQFPKMYLPTFAGWLSIYRGINAFALNQAGMLFWSHKLERAAEEALLPDTQKPSNQNLLYGARYAIFRRYNDELSGSVAQYPHVNPYHTGNNAVFRDEHVGRKHVDPEVFAKLARTGTNYSTPSTGNQRLGYTSSTAYTDPYGSMSSSQAYTTLPDLAAIRRGNYDLNSTAYQPPRAGTSIPNPSITNPTRAMTGV